MCHEDDPAEEPPDAPAVPDHINESTLIAYAKALQLWGVEVIGVYRRELARRSAIASCLADYRRRGLIN